MKFNVATGIKNQDQIEEITAFFRTCNGKNFAFRYKDWSDFKAFKQPVMVIDQNTLQLAKSYSTNIRLISKPVLGTVKVYRNSTAIQDFRVDYATGKITLDEQISPSDTFTADFEFDVPVRFDTDHLVITMESLGCFSLDEIPVVEVKL
jgi:uncharacterized protein (TIGR02217 family)